MLSCISNFKIKFPYKNNEKAIKSDYNINIYFIYYMREFRVHTYNLSVLRGSSYALPILIFTCKTTSMIFDFHDSNIISFTNLVSF